MKYLDYARKEYYAITGSFFTCYSGYQTIVGNPTNGLLYAGAALAILSKTVINIKSIVPEMTAGVLIGAASVDRLVSGISNGNTLEIVVGVAEGALSVSMFGLANDASKDMRDSSDSYK